MKQEFFICEHCGNIIAMIRDVGVPVFCCGEKMQKITPETAVGDPDKHTPLYQTDGDMVRVSVGAVRHPMTPEHYIEWICMQTRLGIQYVHLTPQDEPVAVFPIRKGDEVQAVYAFCNRHALWKK